MLSTFLKEDTVTEESVSVSKTSLHAAVESTCKPDWDHWVARYTSIKLLLKNYMENDDSWDKLARRRMSLYFWWS